MKLPAINPTQTKAWSKLQSHFEEIREAHMRDLFANDTERAPRFSVKWNDFYVDYSKNRITDTTKQLLLDLAEQTGLKEAISLQFAGSEINETEGRAVLHTALRDLTGERTEVTETLRRMQRFSENIINGKHRGYSGKRITTVVNVGIGGSDLGPKMVVQALQHYRNHLNLHFISNVDGDYLDATLKGINPEETIFIIVSKSFGTQETLTNATAIKEWFGNATGQADFTKHFVAVSANREAVLNFGIGEENIFPVWEWVGGRFSLWSAVGLSICLAVGYSHFEKLLQGAHKMDLHFKETEFSRNMPILLGLLSVWYTNFFEFKTQAVIPYSQALADFVPYLQQVAMESNGKSVDRSGKKINYATSPIIWGNVGTNAQHAFFQLLHQGTHTVPTDFILFKSALNQKHRQHAILTANCLAQSEALLLGTMEERSQSKNGYFAGNKPSNILLIEKLTPENLGSLLALYEHKYFVEGVIWNIFSYDQWGVELGKKIASNILQRFNSETPEPVHSSTQVLLNMLKN
ncbi:MAG: glucose-6-phosphate isomerase [Flavobacteriaceae bacterium]|nr:glucose-6-phosphate isomerase [Flavobacteriaceae bacterium]